MVGLSSGACKRIRCRNIKFPIPHKVKEVHFKIINDINQSGEILRLKFNIDLNNCTFCESEIERMKHLFFSCNIPCLF